MCMQTIFFSEVDEMKGKKKEEKQHESTGKSEKMESTCACGGSCSCG